jgi:hypothetical protein
MTDKLAELFEEKAQKDTRKQSLKTPSKRRLN